jgi:CheY-like chemotaxis protein
MDAWILVVDDDPGTRDALKAILGRAGYRVAAWDGEADLETVTGGRGFGVAIVDYHLPRGTGLEVARRLRLQMPACRIILMSSEAPQATADKAPPGLVDLFLPKPFSKETILGMLDRLCQND